MYKYIYTYTLAGADRGVQGHLHPVRRGPGPEALDGGAPDVTPNYHTTLGARGKQTSKTILTIRVIEYCDIL